MDLESFQGSFAGNDGMSNVGGVSSKKKKVKINTDAPK